MWAVTSKVIKKLPVPSCILARQKLAGDLFRSDGVSGYSSLGSVRHSTRDFYTKVVQELVQSHAKKPCACFFPSHFYHKVIHLSGGL